MYEDIRQYILVTLFVGLFIATANYLLGFSKEERNRRREAKIAFESVFRTDLDRILQSRGDARKILSGKEAKYEETKNTLRKHLHSWQRPGFDRAWKIFFYHPENKDIPFMQQYMDFGNLGKRKECHELLSSRISALLRYARIQH